MPAFGRPPARPALGLLGVSGHPATQQCCVCVPLERKRSGAAQQPSELRAGVTKRRLCQRAAADGCERRSVKAAALAKLARVNPEDRLPPGLVRQVLRRKGKAGARVSRCARRADAREERVRAKSGCARKAGARKAGSAATNARVTQLEGFQREEHDIAGEGAHGSALPASMFWLRWPVLISTLSLRTPLVATSSDLPSGSVSIARQRRRAPIVVCSAASDEGKHTRGRAGVLTTLTWTSSRPGRSSAASMSSGLRTHNETFLNSVYCESRFDLGLEQSALRCESKPWQPSNKMDSRLVLNLFVSPMTRMLFSSSTPSSFARSCGANAKAIRLPPSARKC
eukprot:6178235-Pleurochrysis_carterae.AAC.1